MSLFQCENCGCVENTATSLQGFKYVNDWFDWKGIEKRKGLMLCSLCGPTKYIDGTLTRYGKWHGLFPRTKLEIGKYITNKEGNLEHKDTGEIWKPNF